MRLKVLWTIARGEGLIEDINMLRSCPGFDIDVLLSDYDEDCMGFAYAGNGFILPSPSDCGFIDSVLELCRTHHVTTIIPQYGKELVVFSENVGRFAAIGVKVLISGCPDELRTATRKDKLYAYFERDSFVPEYLISDSPDDLFSCIERLGYPGKEVCIKPVDGEASEGVSIISDRPVNPSDIRHVPTLSLSALKESLQHAGRFKRMMCTEFLPGTEYSVDCVADEGKMIVCIPRIRYRTVNALTTVAILENNREIIGLCSDIMRRLKLSYNVNLQFKYGRDHAARLTEINPRVSGSLIANLGAGINMLEIALKVAYGLPYGIPDIKWGATMYRYYSQFFRPSTLGGRTNSVSSPHYS